jgi:hypothetical protein
MGEFIATLVDRRSGLVLKRQVAANLIPQEGMQFVYGQIFPPYQAAMSLQMGVCGATDEGRPNEGGGLSFDHLLTHADVSNWGSGGDDGANEGGAYTSEMAASFGYARIALTFDAQLRAEGGELEASPVAEFTNDHSWEPQDGDDWDDPTTSPQKEQPPPEWKGVITQLCPDVGYPWHWPRKLCADRGTSLAYMKTWDSSGDLDWLCDFRKIGAFPITMAFIARSLANKVIAATKFRDPILLRPGCVLYVEYRARIDGNVTDDFAHRWTRFGFEGAGVRYTSIYCRPLLGASLHPRRASYADAATKFHTGFGAVELPVWEYNAGTPPFMTSAKKPEWINQTGAEVSPFNGLAVYGVASGTEELMWVARHAPIVVPKDNVLRYPSKVKFTLESV